MATDTKVADSKVAESRGVRFQDEQGNWVELEVTDPKMLAQMRNLHDKKMEETHSKTRVAFQKAINTVVQEAITEELETALAGMAIVYRIGKDGDDEVKLEKSSMVIIRQRAAPKTDASK